MQPALPMYVLQGPAIEPANLGTPPGALGGALTHLCWQTLQHAAITFELSRSEVSAAAWTLLYGILQS